MRNLREYYRPATAVEAAEIKRRYGPRGAYLAGGSDLMVHRPPGIEAAIDIRHAGLGYVGEDAGDYVIGGAALLRDVDAELGHLAGGMLGKAVRDTAPWLIRNAATLAGNVANASPAADSVPALLALDARLVLLDGQDEQVPLAAVLAGPHRTRLGDRLIREIRLPKGAAAWHGGFLKLSRSKSDLAQVNVAVTVYIEGDWIREARIALGAVAPTAIRVPAAEELLTGQRPTRELLQRVAAAVDGEVRPISDWRASAEYRRRMSGVLVRRALEQALDFGETE